MFFDTDYTKQTVYLATKPSCGLKGNKLHQPSSWDVTDKQITIINNSNL